MRYRAKKLVVYMLVTMLVCQLLNDDVIKVLAETIEFVTDYTITSDSSDDYIYTSGGIILTISEGVTLSGKVDFSKTTVDNLTLKNDGTITGDIITGDASALLYNNGTISSGSFHLNTGSVLYNSGTISSVALAGGQLQATGGSIGTISDSVGSNISLSGCTIGSLVTPSAVTVEGTIQATSITAGELLPNRTATVEVSDYIKATNGIDESKVVVQKMTVIDTSAGSGYSVYYKDQEYVISAGVKGTILDYYGKKFNVLLPDNSHIILQDASAETMYLPGETTGQFILNPEAGYYFPEDYCNKVAVDGKGSVTATRVSDEEIVISYTFAKEDSKDVTITLASASVKPKEQGTGTIEVSDIYYGGEVKPILASSTNDIGSAKIEYKRKSAKNSEYRTEKPTEVGAYIARVTFNENANYTSCTDTTEFKIQYLPIPDAPYVIKGNKGDNGFYITKVEIIPRKGYSIANKLNGSYKESLIFTSTQDSAKVYFQKDETGEKTKGKKLPELKIDVILPSMSAIHGETYYGKTYTVRINDDNLSVVTCNNVNMNVTGNSTELILDSNNGSNTYRIYARDLAGNSRQVDITVADEWVQQGVIPANQLVRLSTNTPYQLADGTWKIAGDTTQYNGGHNFYVRSDGEYTFGKE